VECHHSMGNASLLCIYVSRSAMYCRIVFLHFGFWLHVGAVCL
jgi:hypothetical protein